MRHVVEFSNPYESPKAPAATKPRKIAPSYRTRMQAVRGEMWQGAKFAFRIVLMVYSGLLTALIVTAIVSSAPGEFARLLQRLATREGLELMGIIGFVVPTFLFVPCVLFASPMMGICAAIQWRPPPVQEAVEGSSEFIAQTDATPKRDLALSHPVAKENRQ